MKTSRSRHQISLAVFISTLLLAKSAGAATLTVSSIADAGGTCPGADCTLRQAIATAAVGDTINFALPANSAISLTSGQLLINKTLTITGPGANLLTVERAAGAANFRIIRIQIAAGVTISGVTLHNGSEGLGGAIYADNGFTLRDCTISGSSGIFGGGIHTGGSPSTIISNCTFFGNAAINSGGAIFNASTDLFLTNSTLSGNNSVNTGGAIYTGDMITVRNCTIYGNSGSGGGGISNPAGGTARVGSTIVAGNINTDLNTTAPDISGTFISEGYNLISSDGAGKGFTGPGDQVFATEARVSPLQDNGGPTKTHKLLPGSTAIDKGKTTNNASGQPLSTDQRGQPRPADRVEPNAAGGDGSDIGAVELGLPQTGPTFTVTTILEHDESGCTMDDCTLVEALSVSNLVDDLNTINFAPGLTGAIGTAILTPSGLAITKPVTISGPGARSLAVTGRTSARVFNVTSQNVHISGLNLLNGRVTNTDGGIIRNTGGLTLTECNLNNGYAAAGGSGDGGAIHNGLGASLTLNSCTVSGNRADQVGGGIFNEGILSATNCTFSGNTAIQGGGIYSAFSNNASKVSLRNCTITKCSASDPGTGMGDGGGGLYVVGNSGQYNLGNSIVAGNTGARNPDLRGQFFSDGHNLIRDVGFSSTFDSMKGDQVGTFGAPREPLLVTTLANNGGATDTHALQSGSTAINNGDDALAPGTDQRGYFRTGVSDIGAFEFSGVAPLPPTVTIGTATNITSTSATLNASVNPNGLGTTFQFQSDFGSFPVQDAGNGTAALPLTLAVTGLAPNTQYRFNGVAISVAGTTQGFEQTFTTLPVPTTLANISTRLRVQGGDNVLIGGMIATGTADKRVIIRAIGPTLTDFGLAGALTDPTLELFQGNTLVATNDDWRVSTQQAEIQSSGLAPGKDAESAIIATLTPNQNYTAIVRGKNGESGLGVVDAFDLDQAAASRLANISTRGFVDVDDNVLIAGLIVGPSNGSSVNVLVRALGPTLGDFGVQGFLADPTLELVNSSGTVLRLNDSWQSDQSAQIQAANLAPNYAQEAALVETLNPGAYTAVVRGNSRTTGVGLVEVYNIP